MLKISYKKLLFQWGLASGMIFILLLALAMGTNLGVLSVVGASSLASSTVIVFVSPETVTTSKHILLGYLLCTVIGIICFYIADAFAHHFYESFSGGYQIIFAVVAVALTILLMAIFRIIHPPAVGFAVGLVLDRWDVTMLSIFIGYTLLLCLVWCLLRNRLSNLV
jgi:CBS-domain-containing membrane protein